MSNVTELIIKIKWITMFKRSLRQSVKVVKRLFRYLLIVSLATQVGETFCHSPTQPQLELELDFIMGMNPSHPGTFKALPDNLGS
jgi:hypothetical protein